MDYRYIDWDSLLKGNLPSLFKSVDGHPIIFYFCIDNSSLKQKLEELVIRNGGDTVEDYFKMNPMTALMVDEKNLRNFYNRVSFKTSYIIDCVKSGYLHDINKYIHSDLPTTRNCDYMDVIFFRKYKFNVEKPCFCSKQNYNAAKTIRSELPEINSQTIANFTYDSNYKVQKMIKEQCVSSPNHRAEGENARKSATTKMIEKCLNPCSHCSLQVNQSRPSTSSHQPSVTHNFVRYRSCDENLISGKNRSTCKCRSSGESYNNEHHSSISGNEVDDLQNTPDCRDHSDSDVEERASRLSDNDSDLCRYGRRQNVVVSDDDDDDDANSGDCDKNTNICTLPEDEDDIGPPVSSTSRKFHIPDKHTRKLYSRKEKEAILKYIIKHDAIESVRGMVIWKRMERSNICPERTWMSMQNHFKKSLCKELDQFPFLTPSQKKALRG